MKKFLITLLILGTATASYGALTPAEETFISNLFANKDKLQALYQRSVPLSTIADTLGSETLPLDIAKLRQQREGLIQARENAKDAIKAQAVTDMNAVDATYAPQIVAINNQIATKEAELDALTP